MLASEAIVQSPNIILCLSLKHAASVSGFERRPRCLGCMLSVGHAVNFSPAAQVANLKRPTGRPCFMYPQDIPLDVVYEDAHVLIVNKAAGMVVHPSPGHPTGTLVNAVLHRCNLPAMRVLPGQRAPASLDADWGAGVVLAASHGCLQLTAL